MDSYAEIQQQRCVLEGFLRWVPHHRARVGVENFVAAAELVKSGQAEQFEEDGQLFVRLTRSSSSVVASSRSGG